MFLDHGLHAEDRIEGQDNRATLAPLANGSTLPAGLQPTKNGLTTRDFTLDDPLDLYPVGEIFQRCLNEELAACAPGQPLVVLMGERHSMPTHLMTHCTAISHIAALRQADPSRSVLIAYEKAYNSLALLAKKNYNITEIRDSVFYGEGHDPDGRLVLHSVLADKGWGGRAPRSKDRVFRLTLDSRLQALFNDCALIWDEIDPDDPLLPSLERDLSYDFDIRKQDMHGASAYGMAMRNLSMVRRAFNNLQIQHNTPSPVIYQQCGRDHIFGFSDRNIKLKHSLSAQYIAAGARVLPVFLTSEDRDYRPETVIKDANGNGADIWDGEFSDTLILRGLDEAQHFTTTDEQAYLEELENVYGRSSSINLTAPFHQSVLPPSPDFNHTQQEIRRALGADNPLLETWMKKLPR